MPIVRCIHQSCQGSFELILVVELATVHGLLNAIQASQEIHGRLPVARRRVLEVCKGALELERVVPVLQEARGDGAVEGDAREAVVDQAGIKEKFCLAVRAGRGV